MALSEKPGVPPVLLWQHDETGRTMCTTTQEREEFAANNPRWRCVGGAHLTMEDGELRVELRRTLSDDAALRAFNSFRNMYASLRKSTSHEDAERRAFIWALREAL